MGGREVALCILNEFRIIGGSAFSALWDSGSDGAGLAPLVTFGDSLHHQGMAIRRFILVLLILSSAAFAGIVDHVREKLADDNFAAAESDLGLYKLQNGTTPEYLEALSWMGRAALSKQQYSQAETYAKQTQALVVEQLKTRKLDDEPHLPIALGAALEVEAQTLAAQGRKTQGVALLRSALVAYGNTSIAARLHKNLNLLSFIGRPAPALKTAEYLGMPAASLAQLKGSPVLLFFWAHWCVDCKGEAPILARLRSEFKGLSILAPTQRYGYAAQGEDATPQAEMAYINSVWQRYYAGLQGVGVPVGKENFNEYGASTTPTLVLVDRTGKIAFYHPGALPYDELKAAIEKVMKG
jgi:thiol-disulfide isomerase/thioredoxin